MTDMAKELKVMANAGEDRNIKIKAEKLVSEEAVSVTAPDKNNLHCGSVAVSGNILPLTFAQVGEKRIIAKVKGKDEQRKFMCNLGFTPGAEVTLVSDNSGNMIVSIKGTRVAINKTMASRIMTAESYGTPMGRLEDMHEHVHEHMHKHHHEHMQAEGHCHHHGQGHENCQCKNAKKDYK